MDPYRRPRGWNLDEQDDDGRPPPPRKPPSAGAVVLGAAMLGLAEVLEPHKTKVVIEQQNDDPLDDDLGLDFGDLPSLE